MRRSVAWLASAALVSCASAPPVVVDVGGQRFEVEVAATADQQRLGLAGRSAVAPGTGMLFLFSPREGQDEHEEAPISVTMAGMLIDLDIAWIRHGRVISTLTVPACPHGDPATCPLWESPGEVDALLEVASGELAELTPNASIATISTDGVTTPVGGSR